VPGGPRAMEAAAENAVLRARLRSCEEAWGRLGRDKGAGEGAGWPVLTEQRAAARPPRQVCQFVRARTCVPIYINTPPTHPPTSPPTRRQQDGVGVCHGDGDAAASLRLHASLVGRARAAAGAP
jgi:hypothetical protein